MKNLSLNAKFVGILGVFVVACVTISILSITSIRSINDALQNVTDVLYKRVAYSLEERGMLRMLVIEEKNYIDQPAEDREAVEKRIDELQAKYKKVYEEWYKGASEFARPKLEQMMQGFTTWSDNNRKVQALVKKNDVAGARNLSMTTGRTSRIAIEKILEEIVEYNKKLMNEGADKAEVLADRAAKIVTTASILAILIGLALAFVVLRAVNRAIDTVITNLSSNSNEVTSAAQQIAASSEQLSSAATEQAASLQETAASIEEMNSMIRKNSDNANKASEVSNEGQQSANKGKAVVGEMLKAIDEINESNNQISEIVKVIAEIENKTKVINDIVFKTQLLSFNASVEAARAGAHGKGFAVVAEEVGKLAQLSGNAAREISEMLATSVQKVNGLVTVAKEKVQIGTDVAQQCGAVLEEIVESVTNLNQMANEIATASQEQAKGCEEVTRAMSTLDQVTQENASTSEEAASAAEELSAQAVALKGVVEVLVQTIKGGEGHQVREQGALAAPASYGSKEPAAKVLHMKHAVSKKSATPFNKVGTSTALKKAVGAEMVSEDDPRFKDV